MLSSATALNGAAPHAGLEARGSLERYEPSPIDPQSLEALNLFYRRRSLRTLQVAGQGLTIKPIWQEHYPEIDDPWVITLSIADSPAELVLPETVTALLIKGLSPAINLETLAPAHAGLLLEHALSDALAALEATISSGISIQSAQRSEGPVSDDTSDRLVIRIGLEGLPGSWCLLKADPHSLLRFAKALDGISNPASDLIDVPLPVNVRWAAVDLSVSELKSLVPGDIVLVDHTCSEHETAMAVIGDRIIAPVKIVPDGYQLLKPPVPLKNAHHDWCAPNFPVQNALLGEGSLQDIPLRVFFEFARFDLPYFKLRELKQGTVIGSGQPYNTNVDLVASGMIVGRGEPTTIGSGLGVRIVKI